MKIKRILSQKGLLVFIAVVVSMMIAATGWAETQEFNRRATATAQILAGIAPNPPEPILKRFVDTEAFKEHQQWMTNSWNQVRPRIQTMQTWRSQEIKLSTPQKKTLLYPFSGPDFLNAYTLFPDHGRYVFFSLERP